MTFNNFKKNIGKLPISIRLELLENISKTRLHPVKTKGYNKIDGSKEAYNHELELLSIFFVLESESKGYSFDNRKLSKWWQRNVLYIREQEYITNLPEEELKNADKIMSILLNTQQSGQERLDLLKFRYSFIFNYVDEEIDMTKLFFRTYKVSYNELLEIIETIHVGLSILKDDNVDFMLTKKLKKDKFDKIKFLIKDRSEFINEYKKIKTPTELSQFTNFNLLEKYPFIKHDERIYLPYAPFIFHASTSSLLFDITKNKNEIRQLIGKNVLENYIKEIVYNSEVTNGFNIIEEYEYKKGFLTSDFILNSNNDVLFLEVKLFNQSLKTRQFDEESIEFTESKLVNAITQVYRNMLEYDNGELDKVKIKGLKKHGIVVISSKYNSLKRDIYEKALINIDEKLGVKLANTDLLKNILIMDISSFEQILIHSKDDIFDYLNILSEKDSIAHFNIIYKEHTRSDKPRLGLYDSFNDNYYKQLEKNILKNINE